MEEEKVEVTKNDILKHYVASLIVYGIALLIIIFCPILGENIDNSGFNYMTFFTIYYLGYVIFAYPILLKFKPKSVLTSNNVAIIEYVQRQFTKSDSTEKFLQNIEPKENEKQAMMILFMKAFFGVLSVTLICNKYIPSLDYNLNFLKEMFYQALNYSVTDGVVAGTMQYIDDTADMWLKIIMMISTIILAISYLTDLDLFKNKIKSIDTTPLGVITCIMCYYPITLLTNKVIISYTDELIPVQNFILRLILNVLVVLVNFISLLAILRLGTKAGNLTNRGIVTAFPYNIIRHPSYAMQMCYLILTTIPLYFVGDLTILDKILYTIGTIGWIYLYYLRSITEERHLIKDPEYQKYIETVKYRFIPKVF